MIDNFVFIVGAMRCGTTSLFHYLAEHPSVSPCFDKEPDFFALDSEWQKGLDWYQGLWSWDPRVHRIALEASTNYSKHHMFPRTTERIAKLEGRVRFIYSMRDPIERIQSHYTLGLAKGWPEAREPLSAGVHPALLDVTRYATQLEPFAARYPRSDILLLAFEELRADPRAVLRRICRFLEIDPDYEFHGTDVTHNSNEGRRPGEFGSRVYRYRTWIPFWRSIARQVTPSARNLARRLLARPGSQNAQLTTTQRARVMEELAPEIERLRAEWGFDPGVWRSEGSGGA